MRTLRLSLVGAVLVTLLGGMGTVAAQSGDADAKGASSPAGSLTRARASHTATLLPDGGVLVLGGWGAGDTFPSAEVWDPATESFGPAGSLVEARANHTATLLPDGRILVAIGGLGIHLVRTVMDDVDYVRRGDRNVVTVIKRLEDGPSDT